MENKEGKKYPAIIGEITVFLRIGNCYFRLEMARIVVFNINISLIIIIFIRKYFKYLFRTVVLKLKFIKGFFA